MKRHLYAVKYIDKNGYAICNGYAESMAYYPNGTIIEPVNGMRLLIEFEMEWKNNALYVYLENPWRI